MTVLLVEDEKSYALFMKHILISNGIAKTVVARSADEAVSHARNHDIGLVLMDIDIEGDNDGVEAANLLRSFTSAPIIFLTASHEKATISRAIKTNPYGYLFKPCQQEELFVAIETALERFSQEQEVSSRHHIQEQAQKLETVGALAAGIAHDFNNILAIIHSHAEILRLKTKPQSPHYKYIESIFNASTKGAALVKGLMQFTRAESPINRVFSPSLILEETVDMLRRLIRKDIAMTCTIEGKIPDISFVASQFQQIVINLCLNARDAIQGAGEISLEARSMEIEDKQYPTLEAGEYVYIEISDTGKGIPLGAVDKIFEPFFTTKAADCGTGLGLAMSLRIARKAGGDLQLIKTSKEGSTFAIYLPVFRKFSHS